MTDWLMVIITAVYVVATIFICIYNGKSAKAAREQLAESQRQFNESNRPNMSCQYILVNRLFCGIRFYNYGNKPAFNVKFKINQAFLDMINDPKNQIKEGFSQLTESEYFFGINQSYDFFFSDISFFKNQKKPFVVEITYSCDGKDYSNVITIDFSKQLPVYSFNDPTLDALKKISSNISDINRTLIGTNNETSKRKRRRKK